MGRPEILLAVPGGRRPAVLETVLELIEQRHSHRVEGPPLTYIRLDEIDEQLDTRAPGALTNLMAIVLLPEQQRWPEFAGGMSLTVNSDMHESPVLQLVCRYPEVYWVFVRHPEDTEASEGYKALLQIQRVRWDDHVLSGDSAGLLRLACLIENHAKGFRTLFDPTGLRAAAHWHLTEDDNKREQGPSINALSVEDESSFALYNGYTLFRRGFSTYVASTLSETRRLLGDSSIDFSAVIEDLFLNFRDGQLHTLRDTAMLPNSKERPEDLLKRRMAMFQPLRQKRESLYHLVISAAMPEHQIPDVVWASKPYGGMFALELQGADKQISKIGGIPERQPRAISDEKHGKPGALHAVAEDLVRRAGEALNEAGPSSAAAIHGAVLALEARRCLADSKSALTLTALSLQHRSEVIADCMFMGRMEDLNANRRLDDLKQAVRGILLIQDATAKIAAKCEIQCLDAMTHFATELGSIYDAYGQFDEAESLRQAVLQYQIDIQVARSASLREPVSVVGLLSLTGVAFKYYIGLLLRSGWHIALACILWIGVFGALYTLGAEGAASFKRLAESLLTAGFFFVSGNAPPIAAPVRTPTLFVGTGTGELVFQVIVFLNCVCGFVHLGIFIAYIYSKVARK
jgi:hypothetical protein